MSGAARDWSELVTGRGLVAVLQDLGVGRWGADAVRQWIREEPPCPVAEPADQGKPHRYRIADVLAWLRMRSLAERAKGFRRGDGEDPVQRIDAALATLAGNTASESADPAKALFPAPNTAAPQEGERGSQASEADPVSPGKRLGQQFDSDPTQMPEVEVLLGIIRGRDPRNWKAAEEALRVRRERLEKERKLIPVEELEFTLSDHADRTFAQMQAARARLRILLRDLVPDAYRIEAERIIDETFDDALKRLSDTTDLDVAEAPGPAPTDAAAA